MHTRLSVMATISKRKMNPETLHKRVTSCCVYKEEYSYLHYVDLDSLQTTLHDIQQDLM